MIRVELISDSFTVFARRATLTDVHDLIFSVVDWSDDAIVYLLIAFDDGTVSAHTLKRVPGHGFFGGHWQIDGEPLALPYPEVTP